MRHRAPRAQARQPAEPHPALPNPVEIYQSEVLPEIAPDLVGLTIADTITTADQHGSNGTPGTGSFAPENG